ncbi:MAG: hypothetical protein J1E82_08305 [Muribaculaceae bacterium]|nr:hypothetical protein [Muribaculaceae bacterium]
MKNFNGIEIENYEYDFNCSNEEELQNVILTEAIKALADGKVAAIITKTEFDPKLRMACKGFIAHLLQKNEIEKFGIEISNNPTWESIRKLQGLLTLNFLSDGEDVKGLCIYDTMDDAEAYLGYSEALDDDEMQFILRDVSINCV